MVLWEDLFAKLGVTNTLSIIILAACGGFSSQVWKDQGISMVSINNKLFVIKRNQIITSQMHFTTHPLTFAPLITNIISLIQIVCYTEWLSNITVALFYTPSTAGSSLCRFISEFWIYLLF